jgi:UDP-N-acetylglucosamine 2-epimerase (non-hydrolysing)
VSRRRVAVFMGTRPEAIKLAPVVAALERSTQLEPVVIATGQHREMLDQVVRLLGVEVHHDLAVMRPGQTLAALTAALVTAVDEVLRQARPDFALVQGDTTTTFVASLCCFYRGVAVGHVEAGLRTGDLRAPFPEEANRKLTTPLAALHFAPTERARRNLLAEGVPDEAIQVTGNTVVDALLMEVARQEAPAVRAAVEARLAALLGADWLRVPYVLVTGHRRESFGRGFEEICEALRTLAARLPDHRLLYPVHLNPNVNGPVRERLGAIPNVRLVPPQEYRTFVSLMRHARLLLTDSGGVQEEALSLGKPVLVMRDTTERPEGIEAGGVRLVGADAGRIVEEVLRVLGRPAEYRAMAEARNPYGDGHAAERIVERVAAYWAARDGGDARPARLPISEASPAAAT